jgi:uncharacterized protein (TIGR02145 family)
MKTTTFFVLLFLLVASLQSFALNYTITFSGTGASTTVGSVIVQNLTKGTSVTVPAGNVLNLIDATAVEQLNSNDEFICIYPNLKEGKSTLSFYAKQSGSTHINAFSPEGRKIAGITANLQTGVNSFQVSLPNGFYVIHISGNGYSYIAKMMNQSSLLSKPDLVYIGTEKPTTFSSQKSKSYTTGITAMTYATDDQLLYKAVSGNYSTIVADIPTGSKTINFGFVECHDADGNYYSVVAIGTQTWMAENLKTAKYQNSNAIPNVMDDTAWAILTTGGWCNYNNDTANEIKYGKLYNWFAVSDSRNIAPAGFHVPTDAELTTLTDYLGGDGVAGGKLKETGILNWASPNAGATNETGFSALPCGNRGGGPFTDIGYSISWWSSSQYNSDKAFYRIMSNTNSFVNRFSTWKTGGLTVRCVKD